MTLAQLREQHPSILTTVKDCTNLEHSDRVIIREYLSRKRKIKSFAKSHLTKKGCNFNVVEEMIKEGQIVEYYVETGDMDKRKCKVIELTKQDKPLVYSAILFDKMFDFQKINLNGALTLEKLVQIVSAYFNVTVEDVKGKNRRRIYILPRHTICYIGYYTLKKPLSEIGEHLGNRDHSSVINGRESISNLIDTDKDFRKTFKKLETYISNNLNL